MEVSLSAVDLDMMGLPEKKTPEIVEDKDDRTAEDDVAISEVVSEIEHELARKEPKSHGSTILLFAITFAVIAVLLRFSKAI